MQSTVLDAGDIKADKSLPSWSRCSSGERCTVIKQADKVLSSRQVSAMKNGKQGKRKETLRRGKLPYLEVMEDPH